MTDLDLTSTTDGPAEPEATHPGVWRALSFVLVMAAVIIMISWIIQSRNASDVAAENSRTLDVDATMVFVDEQPLPAGATVAVLGIDVRDRTPIDAGGLELEIPSRLNSMLALFDADGDVHGLALVEPGAERGQVVISPTSTARALLSMSPALLQSDLVRTQQNVSVIVLDEAFEPLRAALATSPNITASNPEVEAALAAILDRVPGRVPAPDQGCDSILNERAVAVTGACIEPSTTGASINNEQDRWILAFAGPAPWASVCAAISPAGTPGSQQNVSPSECGDEALLAAPGPLTDRSREQADVVNRVQIAIAVDLFGTYVAPLADLTSGVAGLNRRSNSQVLGSLNEITSTAAALIGQDPGFQSALDVLVSSATPIERHAAMLAATRVMIESSGGYVEDWNIDASGHRLLLDFYDRVGEQMQIVDRSEWRWTADASGIIQVGS